MKTIKVKLLGELGRKFGRKHEFVARSPRDVISALSHQIEGFKEYLVCAHENNIVFKVVDKDSDGMEYENMLMPCDRLIIAPIISGAGGSVGKIVLGVAMIGLAFVSFGGSVAAGSLFAGFAGGKFALGSGLLFTIGASLVFNGVSQLLTPQPQVSDPSSDVQRRESFLFDRAADLTNQGRPIPVLYGKFLANSPLIVSSAITTQAVPT
jgi:predicted phage tail protein